MIRSLLLFLIAFSYAFPSKSIGSLYIKSAYSDTVNLESFYGGELIRKTSLKVQKDVVLIIDTKNFDVGYYRLSTNNQILDLIIDPKDSIVVELTNTSFKWTFSRENNLALRIKKTIIPYQDRINNLILIKNDKNDSTINESILAIVFKMRNVVDSFRRSFPKSFAAFSTQQYLINVSYNNQKSFFDHVEIDERLIRSSYYPSLIMSYFKQHVEYTEEGFKTSIHNILNVFNADQASYHFCLEYLIDLFDRVGPQLIYDHLIDEYVINDGCVDIGLLSEDVIKSYLKVRIGSMVNNFEVEESNIYEICANKEKVVLLFWSTSCPHCRDLIEQLKYLYRTDGTVEIVGISLDESVLSYRDFIIDLPWPNICDFSGWQGTIPKTFKISKTPSIYVLDKKAKIIGKDTNFEDLKKIFMP